MMCANTKTSDIWCFRLGHLPALVAGKKEKNVLQAVLIRARVSFFITANELNRTRETRITVTQQNFL